MSSNLNEKEFKGSVINQLRQGQKLESKYNMALSKIAALERERDVYKDVLMLVRDGIIDAYQGIDKAAEYIEDDGRYQNVKEAHFNGLPLEMFGGLLENNENKEGSAEDDFVSDLGKRLEQDDF